VADTELGVPPEKPGATLFGPGDLDNAEGFLYRLGRLADAWQATGPNWPLLADRLQHFLIGSSASDPFAFDGILHTLDPWQGKAADEFRKKAADVRSFWTAVIANAYQVAAPPPKGVPQSEQYHYGNVNSFESTANSIALVMQGPAAEFDRAFHNWPTWIGNIVTLIGVLKGHQWFDQTYHIPTFVEFCNGQNFGSFVTTVHTDPSADAYGARSTTVSWQGGGSATVTLGNSSSTQSKVIYTDPSGTYPQTEIYWDGWAVTGSALGVGGNTSLNQYGVGTDDKDHYNKLSGMLYEPLYHTYVSKILNSLADGYGTVSSPAPAKAPEWGQGNGNQNSTNFPGGYPAGTSPYTGLPTGSSPFSSSPLGASAYDPGAGSGYQPGSYDPGAYDPGAGSGYDPYGSLAGADLPGAGGSGLFTPGADSGLGAGGGLGAGTGADGLSADGAGLAGAAGRAGMPMSPGMGAGGGKENKERQRQSWLPEEDDIWGAESDAPGPVL
jgi:hypothetical protein